MSEHQKYPHCDARVLHAPGECEFCDGYASELQQGRVDQGINFTGHSDPDKKPCPADAARGIGGAHTWGGNAPQPIICNNCGHTQTAHQKDESCIFAPGSKWTPRTKEDEAAAAKEYHRMLKRNL